MLALAALAIEQAPATPAERTAVFRDVAAIAPVPVNDADRTSVRDVADTVTAPVALIEAVRWVLGVDPVAAHAIEHDAATEAVRAVVRNAVVAIEPVAAIRAPGCTVAAHTIVAAAASAAERMRDGVALAAIAPAAEAAADRCASLNATTVAAPTPATAADLIAVLVGVAAIATAPETLVVRMRFGVAEDAMAQAADTAADRSKVAASLPSSMSPNVEALSVNPPLPHTPRYRFAPPKIDCRVQPEDVPFPVSAPEIVSVDAPAVADD